MKTLIYDIETTLLASYVFSMGKQVVRHGQLLKGYFSRTHIICITYRWADEKTSKILTWGESEEDEIKMIKEFDELIKQADVVIGKNSNRFDNKHINTQRLWYDLEGSSDWIKYTDDLESQMRKYFYLPSYSLDYFSAQLGLGGKRKMEFQDWVDIVEYRMLQVSNAKTKDSANLITMLTGRDPEEIVKAGEKASKKMFDYGKKDTDDTTLIWNQCVKHFEPKFNAATSHEMKVCKTCGSRDIRKNGTRIAGQTRYQSFFCNGHGGYAGRAAIGKNDKLGKMS